MCLFWQPPIHVNRNCADPLISSCNTGWICLPVNGASACLTLPNQIMGLAPRFFFFIMINTYMNSNKNANRYFITSQWRQHSLKEPSSDFLCSASTSWTEITEITISGNCSAISWPWQCLLKFLNLGYSAKLQCCIQITGWEDNQKILPCVCSRMIILWKCT